ncbi:MAG: hypothetical protein PVH19_07475 [Planctomycetia bacterium]|jgi:uncharacterized protein YabE (DUF348 family)
MKRFFVLIVALAIFTLIAGVGVALDIQVAPQTLVLSSNGGKLTVHTDIPFEMAENVALDIDGTDVVITTFADDCGNLVAQCTKEAAKAAIGEFEGKTTTVTVTLTVDGDSDSEDIRVKK